MDSLSSLDQVAILERALGRNVEVRDFATVKDFLCVHVAGTEMKG